MRQITLSSAAIVFGLITVACTREPEPKPPAVCTPGQNQTCNDDSLTSATWGTCNADGTCTCLPGGILNGATGRCLSARFDAGLDMPPVDTGVIPYDAGRDRQSLDLGYDAAKPDASPDGPPVLDFACATSADCCTAVDYCRAQAWLVTSAQKAELQSYLDSRPQGDMCVDCVPPAVQVRCVTGICVGQALQDVTNMPALRQAHCGEISPPDGVPAFRTAPVAPLDELVGTPARNVFGCGD